MKNNQIVVPEQNNATSPTKELYEAIEVAYDHFNRQLFMNKLPKVIFTTQRSGLGIMGYFSWDRWKSIDGSVVHEISINPTYIARSCLMEVLSTLAHEQAHCWQQCFGKPGRGGYHNKEWAFKMAEIGLMPSNTSEPGGDIVGEQMSHYIIRNGPFFKAYQELISRHGYGWRWMDCFASAFSRNTTIVEVENPGLLILKPKSTPVKKIEWEDLEEMPIGELSDFDGIRNLTSDKRKNKVAYSCSECDLKVWGKPNLRIVCADCDCMLSDDAEE